MSRQRLATIATLPERLRDALKAVREQLAELAGVPGSEMEQGELRLALRALEVIDREMQTGKGRPANFRSAGFTAHVVHEGPILQIDPNLRDLVVDIEMAYQRAGRRDLRSR